MDTAKVPELIRRPFLLLRLIVFAVLLLLNILTLSFAAFNITASRTWEQFVGPGPALTVFNSSAFLFLFMLLIGERRYSHAIPPVSVVLAEVCWTSAMSLLTFVSSVLSTRYGPANMCSSRPVNLAMCSSSILLLPASWMNFFILFAYSATLWTITVLHAPLVPRVWYSGVSDVPWFDFPASRITDLEHQTVYSDAFHSVPDFKHNGDNRQETPKASLGPPWLSLPRGSLAISVASFTPAWAKQHNLGLTRGLHNPFAKPLNEKSANCQALHAPSDPLQRPARVITKPVHEVRFHERDDDPFAAPSRHDTITTKVPDDHDDKARSLQPLSGFSNFPPWSPATTSGEIDGQDQDTDKQRIGVLVLQNPSGRVSNETTTTATAVYMSPSGRKSVSSLFPHDVREEDWNLPLAKPPFRNGRGEGWTTADAVPDTIPTGRSRGKR